MINEILYKKLAQELHRSRVKPGTTMALPVWNILIRPSISISLHRALPFQPGYLTGVFDDIRATFSTTREARMRGYKPGRFSFNVKGGRCEACRGDGIIKIEMHFLPDVYVPCEVCKGKRYNRETLEVRYKGKNIADVLAMTVDEAVGVFRNVPKIHRRLKPCDVGLTISG